MVSDTDNLDPYELQEWRCRCELAELEARRPARYDLLWWTEALKTVRANTLTTAIHAVDVQS